MIKEQYDVIVIGAGPAGSTAALHLAKAGIKTILLDKKSFPREKYCGDGLITDSLKALRRAGLEDDVRALGHSCPKIVMYSPSRIELDIPGEYVMIKRIILDALIANRAVTNGAVFCRGDVNGFTAEPGGSILLSLAGYDKPLKARTVVWATGSNIRRLRDLGIAQAVTPSAIAIRCYIKSSESFDRMVFSYDRAISPGYAWIFPMGGGEYNTGVCVFYGKKYRDNINLNDIFNRFCAEFPEMKRLMSGVIERTPMRGGIIRSALEGADPVAPGNMIITGEAIGTAFPVTAEGIGKALESGELAAKVVAEAFGSGDFGVLKNFGSRIMEEFGYKYRSFKTVEKILAYPSILDFMTKRIKKSRYLHGIVVELANEEIDIRTIYSVRGILKSFWS